MKCDRCKRDCKIFWVKDIIWERAKGKDRVFCIECLQLRIGRSLVIEDFDPTCDPFNKIFIEQFNRTGKFSNIEPNPAEEIAKLIEEGILVRVR